MLEICRTGWRQQATFLVTFVTLPKAPAGREEVDVSSLLPTTTPARSRNWWRSCLFFGGWTSNCSCRGAEIVSGQQTRDQQWRVEVDKHGILCVDHVSAMVDVCWILSRLETERANPDHSFEFNGWKSLQVPRGRAVTRRESAIIPTLDVSRPSNLDFGIARLILIGMDVGRTNNPGLEEQESLEG